MTDLDALARRFSNAASSLGIAMTEHLNAQDPELTAKVAQALESGERLVVSLEFALGATCIRLETIDDYERRRRVMTINGKMPEAH